MNRFTLTIVFNPDKSKVLMCYYPKHGVYNFIGGHVESGESSMHATYRELLEETGITSVDIDLLFIRNECVNVNKQLYDHGWDMYITCGVLKQEVPIKAEENASLLWVSIDDPRILTDTMGFGNCYVFLNEALQLLAKNNLSESHA